MFTNIEVDIRDSKGRNTYAYIADTTAYKLIVYDFKNDESWAVDQAYFYPYPNKAHFKIKGVNFDLMDGVLGLALGNLFGIVIIVTIQHIMSRCSKMSLFRSYNKKRSKIVFPCIR